MRLTDPVELLYLSLMIRWERTAPPNRHEGILDSKPERNTQISRMGYVLQKVAAGDTEHTFKTLQRYTRRKDGKSYISEGFSWMKEPYPLGDGWYFEGCTSLFQKLSFLKGLKSLKLTDTFVACASDFVAGKSVEKYLPTEEDQEETLREIQEKEKSESA
jgi:hypothetical protein